MLRLFLLVCSFPVSRSSPLLSRERVSVEPFFIPLLASSYPYHPTPYRTSSSYLLPAFALLFSKYSCGVSSAKAAFLEDLIPLFFGA